MQRLKFGVVSSKTKITRINLNIKILNKLARRSVWQTATPSTRTGERIDQIEFLKFFNLNKTGDAQSD